MVTLLRRCAPPLHYAADAGYAARVRASFARQGAMRRSARSSPPSSPDTARSRWCRAPRSPSSTATCTRASSRAIVDSAGGYAGFTLFPEDASVLTVEFKLNLLAPAAGERLVAEGFVVKPGRTLAITRGEVHAERGGKRTLVALMQQTLMVMHGKADH